MAINPSLEKTERLVSLDFFRGATIVLMILVNTNTAGENAYAQLQHAPWHGWTFADTVFPFFLWIIGVSIVFSFTKRIKQGHSKQELLLHIFRRSTILFALGLFLNLFPYFDFSTVRIPGVLQRIALTYFFAGVIFLYARPKRQTIWAVFILIAYWLMITFVPVPGYGAGVLEMDGNVAQYIDTILLNGHIWKKTWDPEGILSTIPAIASVLLGVLIGHSLINKKLQKTRSMFLSGIGLIMVGYIMNIWLPINKNLWTSSFSVFMAGLACILFSISYWVIDVKGYKKWSFPFVVFGMNALFLYVLSGLVSKLLFLIKLDGITLNAFIYQNLFLQIVAPKTASLLFSLTHISVLYVIAHIMYRNKLFLKI